MQLPEGYKHVIVMEFESEEALKKYADSPAQKQWYDVYMPIREESRCSRRGRWVCAFLSA